MNPMKRKFNMVIGQRFGKLWVSHKSNSHKYNSIWWHCLCDCGKWKVARGLSLRAGTVKSCGCLLHLPKFHALKHGHCRGKKKTSTYYSWVGMVRRCSNPNTKDWPNYGGRGIRVCKRWLIFENFVADMKEKPTNKHSIDRKNVNGNYNKRNCRWATPKQQWEHRRKERK